MSLTKRSREEEEEIMNAALAAETQDKVQEKPQKRQKRTKTITLVQRVEYVLDVEVDEQDIDNGMEPDEIIEKYLEGMPEWYICRGETLFIEDDCDDN